MPISLNNSNISVQYNTGCNYIIETVKSDVFIRDTRIGISSNLTVEPTVSPNITSNLAIFTHSGGAENQTSHTIYFHENTVCDILIVGGGGAGGNSIGGGGGAGGVVYTINQTLQAGRYNIFVGKGGTGLQLLTDGQGTIGIDQDGQDSFIQSNSTDVSFSMGGVNQSLRGRGGGGGGVYYAAATLPGRNGGSGGGAAERESAVNNGGNSTQGNTLWNGISYVAGGSSGNGNLTSDGNYFAAGGGGAGNTLFNNIYNGKTGVQIDITGTSQFYAAGGGGGVLNTADLTRGLGGSSIGGNSRVYSGTAYIRESTSGASGTGSGGGGGAYTTSPFLAAGSGGSGIVIIKVISPTTNKYLFFNYSSTQTNYTLTFPVRTLVDVNNNNNNLILQGQYNVSLGTANSSILPAITNTSNRLIPLPLSTTSNVSVRYHLLNPVKTTEGAQWTYSSNNPNVYHLGNVGIGTTNPEYNLDVRGTIYSSIGGYTQSGLITWSITSDRRIKENIVKASYEKCLENVNKIELYNFNFKDNCVNTNDKHQLGFIAQEVREVYPKAVEVNKMILNTNETIDDILTLNTTQIDYTLYGAVKNLIEKIDNIDIELENLGSNITYNKDLIRNTSNIFSIITSNISITTSNIFTGTSNISITTSNISIKTSNIFIGTSNIPTETSNIPTETSNIPITTSYIPFDTSNISIN